MFPQVFARQLSGPFAAQFVNDPIGSLDRLASSFLTDQEAATCQVDVREDAANFYIEADLPGFNREQIEVTCESGFLSIKADRKTAESCDCGEYHVRERRTGSFARSFRLPEGVDTDRLTAGYKDGVLNVTIAKAEAIKPRKIEVKTA